MHEFNLDVVRPGDEGDLDARSGRHGLGEEVDAIGFQAGHRGGEVAGVKREVIDALVALQADLRGGAVADVQQRAAEIYPRPLLAVAHGAFFQHGVKIVLVERHRGVDVGGFVMDVMQLKRCHVVCPP